MLLRQRSELGIPVIWLVSVGSTHARLQELLLIYASASKLWRSFEAEAVGGVITERHKQSCRSINAWGLVWPCNIAATQEHKSDFRK